MGYLKGNGKHAATAFKDGSKLLSYLEKKIPMLVFDDDNIMVDAIEKGID